MTGDERGSVATGGKQRDTRAERERVRVYQARQAFHAGQSQRRTRDNLIAGIGGGLLILAIVAGQAVYFTAGPGAPAPSPSSTPTPTGTSTPEPSPTDSVDPSATPTPAVSTPATPTPTPTP
jgi:hypothetical protein